MSEFPYSLLAPATLAAVVAELVTAAESGWMKGCEYQHLDAAKRALIALVGVQVADSLVAAAMEAQP